MKYIYIVNMERLTHVNIYSLVFIKWADYQIFLLLQKYNNNDVYTNGLMFCAIV